MLSAKIDLSALAKIKATADQLRKAVVATNVDLWNDCVMGTPVDLGYARASWFAVTGNLTPNPNPPVEGEPAPPPVTPAALIASAGEVLFIANSADYIGVLEFSIPPHSPQNNGWVRAAVTRYESNFRKHLVAQGVEIR
jgi:hypothetical protein